MLALMLNQDVRTLLQVLVTGNITAALLVLCYYYGARRGNQWKNAREVVLAKVCQAIGFFLILGRGIMPDLLSANLGNAFLMVGFYFEANVMLSLIDEEPKKHSFLFITLIICIVVFNGLDIVASSSTVRLVTASACAIALLAVPSLRLVAAKSASTFKRLVGVFYLFFLLVLAGRIAAAIIHPAGPLATTPTQTLSYHFLILLMIFSLAAYILIMKENADKRLADMATTDFITGLLNRNSFFEAAESIYLRYRFEHKPIGILFFDVDHFKSINDKYGHAFGDEVLRAFGETIRGSVRPFDLSCRYGGEEFVVLLSGVEEKGATIVAERIRSCAKALHFQEQPQFKLTVSVGVTIGTPTFEEGVDNFIERADAALYMAKESGRDAVFVYDKIFHTTRT